MTQTEIEAVLARTSAVLLDFDGPVCSVFSTFRNAKAAAALRDSLSIDGLPPADDPLALFADVAKIHPESAEQAEAELAALESQAVRTAAATPGAVAALERFASDGRPVVLVSNNSVKAVRAYVKQHQLGHLVADIVARSSSDASLMKPNPHLLNTAIATLGVEASACVMIGDSVTDVQAARRAGCAAVAYANKPRKINLFSRLGCDAVIGSMAELALDLGTN